MAFNRYLIKRLAIAIPTLVLAVTAVFFAMRFAPGDPASIILGLYHDNPASVARVRAELGLDRPVLIQYTDFLTGLLKGDMGISYRTERPVAQEIGRVMGPTMLLASTAMVLALGLGIPIGVISAARQNSVGDHFFMFLAFLGVSMPVFWSGLMLMLFFSLTLDWLPAVGFSSWKSVILPAVALAAPTMAMTARLTRAEMLEVVRMDYVRTARAKGLSERVVLFRHALRNAMLSVATAAGLQFGGLLAGSVLAEQVFAWPGIGSLMIISINARDYSVVQGTVIVVAAIFTLINLLVDIFYAFLDPRVIYD